MLLGKLCEQKDKTALMYMHRPLQSYCSKREKLLTKQLA